MGRGYAAAKARRQAAPAAAAGQGAVAEPAIPAIGPGVPESFYDQSIRSLKEDEGMYRPIARSIGTFSGLEARAEQARNSLNATTQLRGAAEQVYRKLKQEERSAPTPARAQEVRDAIQRLALGSYILRSSYLRLRNVSPPYNRVLNDNRTQGRVRYEVARAVLQARKDVRDAQRAIRDANRVAKLDIKVLRDGVTL